MNGKIQLPLPTPHSFYSLFTNPIKCFRVCSYQIDGMGTSKNPIFKKIWSCKIVKCKKDPFQCSEKKMLELHKFEFHEGHTFISIVALCHWEGRQAEDLTIVLVKKKICPLKSFWSFLWFSKKIKVNTAKYKQWMFYLHQEGQVYSYEIICTIFRP